MIKLSPYEVLSLPSNSTPTELKEKRRTLLKIHHPDHGGLPGALEVVEEAYNKALKIALAKPCETCNGQGKVLKQQAWTILTIPCEACNSTGKKFTKF